MSKAFTKEDHHTDDDELPIPNLPKGLKNYITAQGYHALRKELEELVKITRPEVVSVVSWAASNGDRSENGDYIYGKKRLRDIDRRIRFLTKRLDNVEVVDPSEQPNKDSVFFGATVLYANQEGDEVEVTIVGIDEADPLRGKISWISPVAKALLKSKEGDTVSVMTPSGQQQLDILSVAYPSR